MLAAGIAGAGGAAAAATSSLLGSELGSNAASDLGPLLAKCGRSRRAAAVRRKITASVSKNSVKIGTLTQLRDQGYPVSFSIYHNVQEGDTLTSIARHYNAPLRTIAAANKIDDIDVLQAGQVLLVPVHPKTFQKITALVLDDPLKENLATEPELNNITTVVQPHTPAPAKVVSRLQSFVRFAAPLLLLAPIIAICVRSLLEAAQARIKQEVSRTQSEKEVRDAQHRPRLKRWQGILEGDRDAEAADGQLNTDQAEETEEERKKREEEELRESYVELEARYVKFLADSGLSKSGYWRGGIPSSG